MDSRLRTLRKQIRVFYLQWTQSRHIKNTTWIILIAAGIGVAGGVVAFAFHGALDWVHEVLLTRFAGLHHSGKIGGGILPRWLFFLVPAGGGLIAGLLVYFFAKEAGGHGTDAVIDAFHNKDGLIRNRVPLIKGLASVITIGTGGSAGYEGPTAQIGAGVGSFSGKLLRVPVKMRRTLLLAGTASGLGAIFRAPLGGALTAVEVLYREDFESESFMPCIVASVVAFGTFTQLTHDASAVFETPPMEFSHPIELLLFALFGVLCTPVSWLYVKSFYWMKRKFEAMKIHTYFKPAIGGLLVGLIAYICPQAIGGGWQFIQQAILGNIAILALLFIALFKIITTSLTIGSGGSGGVFAPSLFIGGMLGGFFGFGMEHLFPNLVADPAAYVLVGMGAFFAGAAKAPIASIVMVCEITGNYALLAPLMLSSVIHVMLSRRWSIYENQKLNKFESPVHRSSLHVDVLRSIRLSSIFKGMVTPQVVSLGQGLPELKKRVETDEVEVYPVINSNQEVVGLLGLNQLRKVMFKNEADNLLIADDLMTRLYSLRGNMDLHEASLIFLRSNFSELPVLDTEKKLLGMVRYLDIIQAYDAIVSKVSAE